VFFCRQNKEKWLLLIACVDDNIIIGVNAQGITDLKC